MWLSNIKGTEQTKHQTFLATRMAVAFNLRIGSVKKHIEPNISVFATYIVFAALYNLRGQKDCVQKYNITF